MPADSLHSCAYANKLLLPLIVCFLLCTSLKGTIVVPDKLLLPLNVCFLLCISLKGITVVLVTCFFGVKAFFSF